MMILVERGSNARLVTILHATNLHLSFTFELTKVIRVISFHNLGMCVFRQ